MASVGAVLSLLDVPAGCDPAFCVVWFRFRLLRRYLALWPMEVGRVYRLLEMVSEGGPGHGPIHLLSASAAEIGFRWDPLALAWSRPGLPLLSNLAGPVQHFTAASLDAWRNKVAADLCGRAGFRSGPLLDVHGSLQHLNSAHVRERDKALLRSVMVGGVWNGFLLGRVKGQPVPCRFCGAPDGDGHLFWECPFLPLVEIRENPEFHDLMRMDKGHWPRCLLWHGWLPILSGVNGISPWASDATESAGYQAEVALGRYSSGLAANGVPLMSMRIGLLHWYLIIPMSGRMVALSLIGSLVYLLQVLGSLLISLRTAGVIEVGVMLTAFVRMMVSHLVEVFVLYLSPSSLFKELRCGRSSWLCNLLVLSTWVLTILVWFDMSVVCLTVSVVLPLLSLLRMGIFSCLLRGCFIFEVLTRFGLPSLFCFGDDSHQRDARHSHPCEDRRDAETAH